jgi:quaternary ammonium compound-resistance protein SugE
MRIVHRGRHIAQIRRLPRYAAAVHRHDMNRQYQRGESTAAGLAMAWLCLLGAGALEIVWALGLKYSHGFTRFWPSVITLAAIALSFALLGLSLKSVPFGTAYAVWTGIGAAGAVVLGICLFGEPADAVRIGCVVLIVAGIVGLRLVSPV